MIWTNEQQIRNMIAIYDEVDVILPSLRPCYY